MVVVPLEFALTFRACGLVVINKLDLLPHVDFDMDRYPHQLDSARPDVERLQVSARAGAVREWLAREGAAA